MDIALLIAGLVAGGLVTYWVTTRFIHRPRLCFNVQVAAHLDPGEFHDKLSMSLRGSPINNLAVFNIELRLKGRADISGDQIPDTQKPTLYFPGFSAIDVRTIDYDESRFDVPLGLAGSGALVIFNIRRIRAGTLARFQLIGTFRDSTIDPRELLSEFYPGAIRNVDSATTGQIKRPWKKSRDET